MGRYTSQDNDCVRERRCLECDHRWKTLQSPEEELHPVSTGAIFPLELS